MSADLDAILAAAKRWDELAGEARQARAMLRKIGVTPGLGLDVWSSNAADYAQRVAEQLREFGRTKEADLAGAMGDSGGFHRFACGCGAVCYTALGDADKRCSDCRNGVAR